MPTVKIAQTKTGEIIRDKLGRMFRKIFPSADPCLCGNKLFSNNERQIVIYCSKECRRKRHNRKR